MRHCKKMLTLSRAATQAGGRRESVPVAFAESRECYARRRRKTGRCRAELGAACARAGTRAVKTVRAQMEVARRLLRALPELRVVQLVRDPRAVYVSRQAAPSYRSVGVRGPRSAALWCGDMARDSRLRRRLEAQHSGRLTHVVFEQLAADPRAGLRNLYGFIQRPVPAAVVRFSRVATNTTGVNRWRQKLPAIAVSALNRACCELLAEVNTRWWDPPGDDCPP